MARAEFFWVVQNTNEIAIWGTFYIQLLHLYDYIQVFVFVVLEQINPNFKDEEIAIKKGTLESRVAQTQNYIFIIDGLILCSLFYNNSLATFIWISNHKYWHFTVHTQCEVNATFIFK